MHFTEYIQKVFNKKCRELIDTVQNHLGYYTLVFIGLYIGELMLMIKMGMFIKSFIANRTIDLFLIEVNTYSILWISVFLLSVLTGYFTFRMGFMSILDRLLIRRNGQVPIKKQHIKEKKKPKTLKQRMAQNKYYLISVWIVELLIIFELINFINHYIFLVMNRMDTIKNLKLHDSDFDITLSKKFYFVFIEPIDSKKDVFILLTRTPDISNNLICLGLTLIVGLLVGKKIYRFYKKFGKINYDQKGGAKFESLKALKKQAVAVPQQFTPYKGNPGYPVSHFNDLPKVLQLAPLQKRIYNGKFLIYTSTQNVLAIGTSRSGKGETSVIPSIEIISRAEFLPSMLLYDPKGELYAACYEELRKRGYDVEVLNLDKPLEGMSYNILQIVKDEYIKGDFPRAEAYASNLTKTLFPTNGGDSDFWQNSAASLVNALIFAVMDRAIAEGRPDKITMRAVYDLLMVKGSNNYKDNKGVERNALTEYMNRLPDDSIAKKQFATTKFAGGGQTAASIYTTASSSLNLFNAEEIAKMGSAHSVDFTRVGFNKRLQVKFTSEFLYHRGIVYFGYGTKNELKANFRVDSLGYMEVNFNRKMKDGEVIKIEIFNKKTPLKTNIFSEFSAMNEAETPLQGEQVIETFEFEFFREPMTTGFVTNEFDEFTGERIYPKTAYLRTVINSGGIEQTTCFYSEKPIAIFMVSPDYDPTNDVIASIFVSQLYTMLARRASESGGQCHQRVYFILDEFGNMPMIYNMSRILTVCLGRNIIFHLYIQDYNQINKIYDDKDAQTIKSNCQIHHYIKSTGTETLKEISERLGNKTVQSTSRNRNSSSFSGEMSESDSIDQVPLMTTDRLENVIPGESVVLRPLSYLDKKNKSIRPNPIHNVGETSMPYRFMYMDKVFNTKKLLADFDMPSLHRELNLKDFKIHWDEEIKPIEAQVNGYISSLNLTKAQIEQLKMLCMKLTGDAEFYMHLCTAKEENLLNLMMKQRLSAIKFDEIKTDDVISEIRKCITSFTQSEQKTQDVPYLSTVFFEENALNSIQNLLVNECGTDEYQLMTRLNKDKFMARMKSNLPEKKQHDLYVMLEKEKLKV